MRYSKYSANGNDFVIFHTFHEEDRKELAIELCDRQNGIGADGLIVLIPHKEHDFKWQFYNSDGSDASMCGNGSRAAAHYAYKNQLAGKEMSFLTGAGVIKASVEDDEVESQLTPYKIIKEDFEEDGYQCFIVDTGVPHVVITVNDLDVFDLKVAKKFRDKYNANVNYVKKENDYLAVRTYERGVEDETLACGTGMAACFLKMSPFVGIESVVRPKSKEKITLRCDKDVLFLKGKVRKVFETFL
ncbi:MAG: diaminopimelate epimerase [Campylobacterales bacterium]|nr:diaminopimelate epimerase [Campylobacterales bacterium]